MPSTKKLITDLCSLLFHSFKSEYWSKSCIQASPVSSLGMRESSMATFQCFLHLRMYECGGGVSAGPKTWPPGVTVKVSGLIKR